MRHVAFESFDVRIRVTVDDPDVLERVVAMLPPNAAACPPDTVTESFSILTEPDGRYRFERTDSPGREGSILRLRSP